MPAFQNRDLPPVTVSCQMAHSVPIKPSGVILSTTQRRWKAYHSGTVEVSQTGRLLAPASASEDGLALRTYASGASSALLLNPAQPEQSSLAQHSVSAGDSLFFRVDTGLQEQGDEVEWNVRLRYTEADFFEELQY